MRKAGKFEHLDFTKWEEGDINYLLGKAVGSMCWGGVQEQKKEDDSWSGRWKDRAS